MIPFMGYYMRMKGRTEYYINVIVALILPKWTALLSTISAHSVKVFSWTSILDAQI